MFEINHWIIGVYKYTCLSQRLIESGRRKIYVSHIVSCGDLTELLRDIERLNHEATVPSYMPWDTTPKGKLRQ